MDHFYNILVELIFIFLHFLLFLINYRIMNKKIMQPAVLFSLLWFIIILLHFIFRFTLLDELYPLSPETFIIFFAGALCFSFGSVLATFSKQKNESHESPAQLKPIAIQPQSLTLRYILLAIIIIGLPFYIMAAYRVFIASNIDNFFVGLRTELSYGDEDIGPLKYLVTFSFVVYAFNLYAYLKNKNKHGRFLLIATFFVTITYAVFSTGRTFFFLILAIYFGLSYLHNKRFSIKKYSWFIIVFIILFSMIGVFYGKGGNTEDSIKENTYYASQTTAIYLVSSVNALDWELHHNFEKNYNGNNTLRFFQKIGESLKLINNEKISDLVKGFVFVPYPTNVYTFYSPYIKDFGKLYAWFMVAIFGMIHTIIHNKAIRSKNIRYSLYYSFMLFPLLLSFFQDQYMSLFSSWLQVVFYTEIFIIINKFFISKKW